MAEQGRGTTVLEVRDLVVGYYEDMHVLRGVSLQVRAGQVTCLLGPNGTGKSTLLKAVAGFLRPAAGEIRYLGRSLVGVPPHAMAGLGIAYLPQRPSIFPYLTVGVNLELGGWALPRGSNRSGERERWSQLLRRFPILGEKWRQVAGQLSGGQQRQVEMARSLVNSARLFLVDEPTAGVEPATASEIYRLLASLARDHGKAVLLVDQNIRKALEIAGYVYVFSNGQVRVEGPRDAFGEEVEQLVARWLGVQEAAETPLNERAAPGASR